MSYALATLWHERNRYLPGVLAVAFSALLIALQCGLLLGLFSITSLPIDTTSADIWVGHPEVLSVDLGKPIPTAWQSYLAMPEIPSQNIEEFIQAFAYWAKPDGGSELCIVIGSRLGGQPMGAVEALTPELRPPDVPGEHCGRPVGVSPAGHQGGGRHRRNIGPTSASRGHRRGV